MKAEIKEITFETSELANNSKSYPHSGLFLVTNNEIGIIDLRFIDKGAKINYFICPESVFNGTIRTTIVEDEPKIIEHPKSNDSSNNEFVLEFARILLNRKKEN